MALQLTAADARLSLSAHVAAKGAEIFAKYGPVIGLATLQAILADRSCVRYPCELVFDAAGLQPGEFAHPAARGDTPEDGFTLFVHPFFLKAPADIPWLALYHLVVVNYGEFASPDDAEIFAAAALGQPREEYYRTLCDLADELDPAAGHDALPPGGGGCGSGGCG